MKNSEWVFVKMTKSVVANLETDGIKYMDTRLQPFITWLQFMNFITIAMISLVFLKIYNGILLLYEWIFPFKHNKLRYPLILVIGSKNELNQKIVYQLSKLFQAKIINLQDMNDNVITAAPAEQAEKQSQILYSQVPLKSQEEILKLSRFVRETYGDIDVLLVSQNEEPPISSGTPHVFLNNLNTQLLIQFWTVMAFLPKMLQKNNGHIVSIALSRTSNLTNTGIMRSVYEELLQTETKVKLTLIERNSLLENYLPALPTDLLAKLIIRSIWSSNSMITVPSLLYYILMIPLLVSQLVFKPIMKFVDVAYTRHHQESVFQHS